MTGPSLLDSLFADLPLQQCTTAPFQRIQALAASGNAAGAREALLELARAGESRVQVQAWNALRALGSSPPSGAEKKVLGVVVEVALPQGLDVLAAYADHTARYYNHSGAGVVWEHADASLDAPIDKLLAVAQPIASQIGVWKEARRPPPKTGAVRLNMLTPSGLVFGEGPMGAIAKDRVAGTLLRAATELMQRLTALPARR